MIDGPEAFEGAFGVSRETTERLSRYAALLKRWQAAQNLVAAATLETLWERHIADSAQLLELAPGARRWLDLGSGAGLPGLVIAARIAPSGGSVTLVESNQRKCAFLRAAIHEMQVPAEVRCERIESALQRSPGAIDVITARALAPLVQLCDWVAPLVGEGAQCLFHKGREFDAELREAGTRWTIDLVRHRSRVDDSGCIVEIRRLEPVGSHQGRKA